MNIDDYNASFDIGITVEENRNPKSKKKKRRKRKRSLSISSNDAVVNLPIDDDGTAKLKVCPDSNGAGLGSAKKRQRWNKDKRCASIFTSSGGPAAESATINTSLTGEGSTPSSSVDNEPIVNAAKNKRKEKKRKRNRDTTEIPVAKSPSDSATTENENAQTTPRPPLSPPLKGMFIKERSNLPVFLHRTEICNLISSNDVVLVIAETVSDVLPFLSPLLHFDLSLLL